MTATAAIVITPGSATANAYCDVAFADQWDANRPPVATTWATATATQKTQAILWATLLMDRLFIWNGYVTDTVQALLWPRQGLMKRNQFEAVDPHTIPIEVQQATAEYARQLLVDDRVGDSDIETQGITSLKAGPVALTFKETVTAKAVPDAVFYLIPTWWGSVTARATGTKDLLRA